jgi:transcriptional regulator with GAF, ATPase, and Fis domain
VNTALSRAVEGLVVQPGVALARIWLAGPGDLCLSCPMRPECFDRTRCLHLVASAGNPLDGSDRWNRLDGEFTRIPLGAGKVGRAAATGEAALVSDMHADSSRITRPDWARKERIQSFAAQPLIGPSGIFGVLGVFSRKELGEREFHGLCGFADHAVVAVANARAFEEIADLNLRLERERDHLRGELLENQLSAELSARSPAMGAILRQIERVAPTDANVLVQGEPGTEKEAVALAIHRRSPQRALPFIRAGCRPGGGRLLEAELFGGGSTPVGGGALAAVGWLKLAESGTLFLDGAEEIPAHLQERLVRAFQADRREGSAAGRPEKVRIVATSTRDLRRDVEWGRFRADLYHRLAECRIDLPPLRERHEDLEPLASHFLRLAAARLNRPVPRLTAADIRALERYEWRGNLIELGNVIERALLLAGEAPLRLDLALPGASPDAPAQLEGGGNGFLTEAEMRQRERENVVAALEYAGWKIYGPGGAADLLGIKPTTLASRIRSLGIERPPRALRLAR